MVKSLILHEMKSGFLTWLVFAGIITLYGSVVVAMYEPTLGESLRMMAQSMPELFAAFGMADPGLTLLDFISNYLYGFIFIVIPLIYIIVMAYRLMGRYIDQGFLAYLLASPNSRLQVYISQLTVLLAGVLMLVLYASLLILGCAKVMFNTAIDLPAFCRMNIGLFFLQMFFAALCYGAACSFNETRRAMSIGAGLSGFFVLMQMLSQVSDQITFMKYLTPLTLFDVKGLMNGTISCVFNVVILFVLSMLLIVIAGMWFKKRDLPL